MKQFACKEINRVGQIPDKPGYQYEKAVFAFAGGSPSVHGESFFIQ
jgi:hypothetical protein